MNTYATILITESGIIEFEFSRDASLLAALKAQVPYVDRKFNWDTRLWEIAPQHLETCKKLVERFFGYMPDIHGIENLQAQKQDVHTIKLMYLGRVSVKDKSGTRIASGHDGVQWAYTFPEAVLREYFGLPLNPSDALTLYAVLGIKKDATTKEIKSAFRRASRTWHPDANKMPDAARQFQLIKEAYDVLSNERGKSRYDAGLALFPDSGQISENWKAPLNCGILTVLGYQFGERFNITKIIPDTWIDIYNDQGQVMIVSWGYDRATKKFDESYTVDWI